MPFKKQGAPQPGPLQRGELPPTCSRRRFLVSTGTAVTGAGAAYSVLSKPGVAGVDAAPESNDSSDVLRQYVGAPSGTPHEWKRQFLEFAASAELPTPHPRKDFMAQLARLQLGKDINEEPIRRALEFIDSNRDTNNFAVPGVIRMLYLYGDSDRINSSLKNDIEACLLRFGYWWDEGRTGPRCFWTENHQILFHSSQLLVGQLFPDHTFGTGRTGREHLRLGKERVRRWMDWRVRFGFSEWLSNYYIDHNIYALVGLRDFAEQKDIRERAEMLLHVLLFEIAMHSWRGIFGSTSGRGYAHFGIFDAPRSQETADLIRMVFGMGVYVDPSSYTANSLATSDYRCPPVLRAIAADLDRPVWCRERHGFNLEDAWRYGLSYHKEEDIMLYWGRGEFYHPLIVEASEDISKKYGVRGGRRYGTGRRHYDTEIARYGKIRAPRGCIVEKEYYGTPLSEVHIQTWRTADYMLSCAQDFRPGTRGYQQHIWQATLGPDTVVFTNHPGSNNLTARPNYWAGNSILPRAAQHRNVLVCVYNIPEGHRFAFSHACFPRPNFDAVVQNGHWVFGRKGQGLIALYSHHPMRKGSGQIRAEWRWPGDPRVHGVRLGDVELLINNPKNVWLCEMGSMQQWKTMEAFVRAVSEAPLNGDPLSVTYESPSLGQVQFGWEGPLRVQGEVVALHDYERFENPYCRQPFLGRKLVIEHQQERLEMDFGDFGNVVEG